MANNQLLASDNFASGSLDSRWTVFPNASGLKPSLSGGPPYYAQAPSVGHNGGVIWTGLTWTNDQGVEVTVEPLTGSAQISLFTRINGAGTTGYYCVLQSTGDIAVYDYATGLITYLTITGVTYSAGDVFCFQSAGSVHTVYQNGIQLGYFVDATFTGGSPGFAVLVNSGSITSAQVASWRGYSAVQQDGVWQKQGIVLAPNSTDLASNGQGLFGGSFIYDSNPQLISGGHCYKTWFSGGTPGSQGTYYAESPDLKTWTRKAAQVISGYVGAQVIKVGSTYYSYSQLQNQAGSGNIALHTSSDGITFSLVSANVLSPGGGGSWDAAGGFYPLRPITVINGTWYALTTGDQGNGQFAIGLATSSDGQIWTKDAGNPYLTASHSSVYPFNTAWVNVNGTYYFWHSVGPAAPQQTSGQDIYFLPAECARYSTTDFKTWVGPVHSIHHSDQYEDVNQPVGATPNNPGSSLGPCAMFTVGKQSYAIGQAEVKDGASGGTQFALAIAPATLAQLVTHSEDAVQQVATESFGGTLANWTTLSGLTTLKIASGKCEPNVATGAFCAMQYTGAGSFGAAHYSEITIATLSASGAKASPLVCADHTAGTYYKVLISGATGSQSFQAQLTRGTTALGPIVGITPNVGDVLRLVVIPSAVVQGGNAPVISFYQNGSLILQYVDESSSALTTGGPGILQAEAAGGTSQVSLWAGGNANVIPNYPPTPNPNTALFNSGIGFLIGALAGGGRR
jgi:hypothetical protein